MARADGAISIELVWSPAAGEVERFELRLPVGATVADALAASGVHERHPATRALAVGVWGRLAALSQPLRERDRVELYRPLAVDPKEARRLRYRGQGGRRRGPR